LSKEPTQSAFVQEVRALLGLGTPVGRRVGEVVTALGGAGKLAFEAEEGGSVTPQTASFAACGIALT
jgi:hypothetical protein